MALLEGVHEINEAFDAGAPGFLQARHPRIEQPRQVHVEGFVGAEGGVDFGGQPGRGDGFMASQVAGGIVGGADGAHTELAQNAVGTQVVAGQ